MTAINWWVLIVISFALPIKTVYSQPTAACKEMRQIRNERLQTDADMRQKRILVQEKIVAGKTSLIGLEKEIVRIEHDIARASGDRREELWKQFDQVSQQKDLIFKTLSPLYQENSSLHFERLAKKLAFKKREIAKQYECTLNDPLNDKLSAIASKIENDEFHALLRQRNALVATVKSGATTMEKAIDDQIARHDALTKKLVDAMKLEDDYDHQEDEVQNKLSDLFEQWQDSLEKSKDALAQISKKLLPFVSSR